MTLALAAMLFPSWAMTTATPAHAEDFNLKRAGIFIQKKDCQKAWEVLRGKIKADPESAYAFIGWIYGDGFLIYPLMYSDYNYTRFIIAAAIMSESINEESTSYIADPTLYYLLSRQQKSEFRQCYQKSKSCRSDMYQKLYGVTPNEEFEKTLLLMSTPGNYGICPPGRTGKKKAPVKTLSSIIENWKYSR